MNGVGDNSDPRDYVLELSTASPAAAPASEPPRGDATRTDRARQLVRSVSIHFKCCHVYAPIYKNAAGTAFSGHCPRCRRKVEIGISPEGSTSRIFQAG